MYKHFIWDFDGTLFDSYPVMAQAFKTAMDKKGYIEPVEKIMSLMKVSMISLYEYCKSKYNISDGLLKEFMVYCGKVEREQIRPFPHIKEVLSEIHMNGGMHYLYTHRGKSSVEYLKKFGLDGYFSYFITERDNFKRKPDPEALLYLIDKFSINKDEAIMIGDRDIDILAGRNAGIDSCFFDDTHSKTCEFADYYISDYSCFISAILG